jgi:multiple sugar transport system ATP-binding protein
MARVALEQVEKRFGDVTVIPALDLDVADGEFVVLVGPSGCGKTTSLRMIAGLEGASAGRIRIGGRDVTELRPGLRNCAMVFQNYALYPHMTVRQNIAYGMKVRGVPAAERDRLTDYAARILGLQPFLDRRPKQLSGGQRQRVAIGRAIVRQPEVFLFDEPLSNLDAKLRIEMRSEIKQLHRRLGNTVVYVTHDQVEAMTLADRVVVMHQGRIEQAAAPLDLYERPANTFVAAFIGAPSMNFVPACVAAGGAGLELAGGGRVALGRALANRLGNQVGRTVTLGVRPEHVSAAARGDDGLSLRVQEIEPLGPHQLAIGEVGGARFVAQLPPHRPLVIGEACAIAADPERLHLFDPATGQAI